MDGAHQFVGSILFRPSPTPVFFMPPVTNYKLYSTLLCKKIGRAPGGGGGGGGRRKIIISLRWGEGDRIDPICYWDFWRVNPRFI